MFWAPFLAKPRERLHFLKALLTMKTQLKCSETLSRNGKQCTYDWHMIVIKTRCFIIFASHTKTRSWRQTWPSFVLLFHKWHWQLQNIYNNWPWIRISAHGGYPTAQGPNFIYWSIQDWSGTVVNEGGHVLVAHTVPQCPCCCQVQ